MGKKKNNNKSGFQVTPKFLKAYDITLKKAVNSLYYESDFRCQSFYPYYPYPIEHSLSCNDCPFQHLSDYCTDPYVEDGAACKRTFEQWQDWFYNLTGKKDNRPKESFMNMEKNEQTKELEVKVKAKYEIEYLDLDSDEPKTRYVQKVVDLLLFIKVWNDEAIKWNLIANGNTSKIPTDFKDIYIKVYDPEEGVILFQDEYTLKSKGLNLTWTRDN